MDPIITHYEATPLYPWQWHIVSTCVCMAMVALGVLLLRTRIARRRGGAAAVDAQPGRCSGNPGRAARWLPILFTAGGLTALACAALGLTRVRSQVPQLIIVVDDSHSMHRGTDKQEQARSLFVNRLVNDLQRAEQPVTRVRVVRFSGKAREEDKLVDVDQLDDSLKTWKGVEKQSPGTNLEEALCLAEASSAEGNGAPVVVLFTDGNETVGDGAAAARRLAAKGIPVHVFAVASPPAVFIQGAAVPLTIPAGSSAGVRALIRNGSSRKLAASLEMAYHHNSVDQPTPMVFTAPLQLDAEPDARAGSSTGLHEQITFGGRGLQAIVFSLKTGRDATHRVTRLVYVRGRRRLLAIGADTRWTDMLNPEIWEVVSRQPGENGQLPDGPFADFDVMAISAVGADQFPAGALRGLRRQVEDFGAGLLLINGDHGTAAEETPAVLTTYGKTELEDTLPVHPGSRPPPPSQLRVVIVVDRSGSMADQLGDCTKMKLAHNVCEHIVSKLRKGDTLKIIAFDDQADPPITKDIVDCGKDELLEVQSAIREITPRGGTNPDVTLKIIKKLGVVEGAFIFISDGQFTSNHHYARQIRESVGPKVITTAFGVGLPSIEKGSPLDEFDEKFAIDRLRQVSSIKLKAVDPTPRNKCFERATFTPNVSRLDLDKQMLPPGQLAGHAVATRSEHPSRVMGKHPENSDPILAFRDVKCGKTGVFAAGIPEAWFDDPAAQDAVRAWCDEVSSVTAPDRYWISADYQDSRLTIRLQAMSNDRPEKPEDARLTQPEKLEDVVLTLMGESGEIKATDVKLDDKEVWVATFDLSKLSNAQGRAGTQSGTAADTPAEAALRQLYLVVKEKPDGAKNWSRPQRLPVLLPVEALESGRQGAAAEEDQTQGQNSELLKAISEAGGGRLLSGDGQWPDFSAAAPTHVRTQYWPELSTLAAILLVLAVFLESAGKKW